jgi:sortase (surface protein transpeptidase)
VTQSRRRGSRGRGPCRPAAPAAPPAAAGLGDRDAGRAVARPEGRSRSAGLAVVGAAGLLAAGLVLGACQWTAGDAGAKAAEPPTSQAPRVVSRASRPASIAIPAAGVDARVVPVGLGSDGAMEVPEVDLAGWYELGPRPGEPGPAVIVGHVDSREGPAVFFRLGQLRRGDRIVVGRDGGAAVAFAVERVERHAKESLPVGRIWNRTGQPVLRLITCGGSFDRATGHYRDNLIVYAKLAS